MVQKWSIMLDDKDCPYKKKYKEYLTEVYKPIKCIHSKNESRLCCFEDCPVRLSVKGENRREYLYYVREDRNK